MNISLRCEYGYRAVLELAGHETSQEPLTTDVIAERRHIPEKFLVHILLQLKRAGIVRSIRGARGGFLLARPPEKISLLNIIEAIDGPIFEPPPDENSESADFVCAWREVAGAIIKVLSERTIQHVMNNARNGAMYSI